MHKDIERILTDYYLQPLREQYEGRSFILELHEQWLGDHPLPHVPWWKRRLNRIRWWWSDNVSWRFARYNPLDDHECW